MGRTVKFVGFAAVFLLGGCGNAAQTTSTQGPTASTQSPSSTIGQGSEVPPNIAFSDNDCSSFNALENPETIQDVVPPQAQGEFGSIVELAAAGLAVRESFEPVKEAFESGQPPPEYDEADADDTAALMDRVRLALTATKLPEESARLAEQIEAACGPTELGAGLLQIRDVSIFMQTAPPAGYCKSLADFGPQTISKIGALAPPSHRAWIDEMLEFDPAEEPLKFLIEGGKVDQYRLAQCAEDASATPSGADPAFE